MKTAKEFIDGWRQGLTNYLMTDAAERYNKDRPDLEEFFKLYAKEAIKADRENVAKHAKVLGGYLTQTTARNRAYVDRSSIINAPQIELL